MAHVVALFDDLLLGSNVVGWLEAGGHEVTLVGVPDLVEPADALVVDLGAGGFDGVAALDVIRGVGGLGAARTLGIYSHVDVDTRTRALAAGYDQVVPRSRLAREGAALVDALLARS